ncbi:MAG: DUF2909 domain-containing protein [bacterium]
MLKVIIVVLLIGVIISLFSGLVFLFKDTDKADSKRTLYALGVRITLAGALLLTIFYGFYTGELRIGTNAPWHNATQQLLEEQSEGEALVE